MPGGAVAGETVDVLHTTFLVNDIGPAGQIGVDVNADDGSRGTNEAGKEGAGEPEPVPISMTRMPSATSSKVNYRWITAGLERCGVGPRPSWWV